MTSLSWVVAAIALVIGLVVGFGVSLTQMPETHPQPPAQTAAAENTMVPDAELMRVPVTGIYPGGTPEGLNPNMQNPLANDPNAAEEGMKAFNQLNCSGCHMANAGGGMGPALSDHIWRYGSSAGQLYLDIAQGRGAGMPAWGGRLPEKTIWELVAYIQSISQKPEPTFGATTSLNPPSPDKEQVPAEIMQTTTPWQHMEPMPPNGGKPGSKPKENPQQ